MNTFVNRVVLSVLLALSGVGIALVSAAADDPPQSGQTAAALLPPVKVKTRVSDAGWKEYPPHTPELLSGFTPAAFPEPTLNKWGGRTDRTAKATGYFRVEKQGDRWWLVDPDGGLFIHVGVAGVAPGTTPTNQAALKEKFGTPEKWADQTTGYLRDLRFNGAGAWSEVAGLRDKAAIGPQRQRLVYTVIGNAGAPGVTGNGGGGFMSSFGKKMRATRPGVGHTTYPNGCIPVFHPDFPAFCQEYAKPLAGFKDDPYLLGYFSDNELPFPELQKYLALSPEDPVMGSSYRAAKEWLEKRKGKQSAIADLTTADKDAWTEYVYDRYLALTTGAIRKYDPHHLCLGPRFYGPEKDSPAAFRAAGRYLDVIGVNVYFVWSPKRDMIARWTEWSGRPVIITEWYAKGMDSGFPNTSGAGWTVPTQNDRGLFYQTFTLGLLESKTCVGWHWFKYMDNDPTNLQAEASNRDANKGMVTNHFEPYPPLANHMRSLNSRVYSLTDYFDKTPLKTSKGNAAPGPQGTLDPSGK